MPAAKAVLFTAVVAGTIAAASAGSLKVDITTATNPAPLLESLHSYSFEEYVSGYGKTYTSTAERAKREAIFKSNLQRIVTHNSNPMKSYTMNVNDFADWTREELKAKRMGKIPNLRRSLYKNTPVIDRDAQPKSTAPKIQLPASVDWRNHSVVTPVKNQGGCGSCWAFASTETLESHWAIKTGKLYELSTQQVTECTPNPKECGGSGGCEGATENLAFDYIIEDGGIVTAKAYPYTGTDTGCHVPASAERVANFSAIVKVKTNDQSDMMEVVATAGPVTVGVWADPWDFYFGGVFDGCGYSGNIDIDHAVQLVGYGTDASVGKDYWIVRNSWGSGWGEGGYIRLLRESTQKCGKDTTPKDGSACKNDPDTPIEVCGQCGILYESSYAVPKVN